jgi:hypothetical protein
MPRCSISDKPTFQVRSLTGAPPPYVYVPKPKGEDALDDDMTVDV